MTNKQIPSVLVVDDDVQYCEMLSGFLTHQGYHVVLAHDGSQAQELCVRQTFSCIVLDVNMPTVNGATFLQLLRAFSFTPVIMCSATSDEAEMVRFFGLGADDYVAKPIRIHELTARIKVAIRRGVSEEPSYTDDGGLYVDPRTRTVITNGRSVKLTPSEFHILTVLMTKANQLVTRRDLVESLYPNIEYTGGFRVLDVHISNIRSKLTSTNSPAADIITSVYGVGYVYNGVKPRV
jgi:DNA-binding response OmpR family regulator